MQIEESFRDLKRDHFGCTFHYSLTRTVARLTALVSDARARTLWWHRLFASAPSLFTPISFVE